jgi:hypothetical protein
MEMIYRGACGGDRARTKDGAMSNMTCDAMVRNATNFQRNATQRYAIAHRHSRVSGPRHAHGRGVHLQLHQTNPADRMMVV